MNYDDLKSLLIEFLQPYEAEFDSIKVKTEVRPYLKRLESGEKPRDVIKEYFDNYVKLRTFSLYVSGERYIVHIKRSDFIGKVCSAVKKKALGNPNFFDSKRRAVK